MSIDGERAVRELARAAALPMRELLPEPLAMERVLPDQHVTQEAVHEIGPHHLHRAEAMPFGAVIRRRS